MTRFNEWLASKITAGVGTMWCAYAFAALTLVGLPNALHTVPSLITWISQSFLQLTLLSIILVGQSLQDKDRQVLKTQLHEHHSMLTRALQDLSHVKRHVNTRTIRW